MSRKRVPREGTPIDLHEHVQNRAVVDGCAERHIARAQAFGHRHDVRDNAIMLQCAPSSAACRTAHDLVGNHEDAMSRAHIANFPGVAGWRRNHSARGANDRLKDKARDAVRTASQDLFFQFSGEVVGKILRVDARRRAIRIRGGDERRIDQCPLEGLSSTRKVGDRQGTQGVSMPGAAPRYESPTCLFAAS
jgi:hypothetical protein